MHTIWLLSRLIGPWKTFPLTQTNVVSVTTMTCTRTGCRPGRKHNDDIPATMMMWELFWKLEEVLWPKTFLIWTGQRLPPHRQDLYSLRKKGAPLPFRPRCGSGKRGIYHQSTCLQALWGLEIYSIAAVRCSCSWRCCWQTISSS